MKATNEARLEDAERIYTEAVTIDPRNKGTNANLLADRAEVYFRMKRIDDCIKDCEASLALDQVKPQLQIVMNPVYIKTFFRVVWQPCCSVRDVTWRQKSGRRQ